MHKLSNNFWIVGTSVNCYLKSFIDKLGYLSLGQKMYVRNAESIIINQSTNEIINFSSKTVLRQSLTSWESLGFIKKIKNSNYYVKIIDQDLDYNFLLNYSKFNIIQTSNDPSVEKYRNSILIKCIYLINNDFLSNLKINTKRKNDQFNVSKIAKEIGEYEKRLIEDNFFKLTIEIIIKEKENENKF